MYCVELSTVVDSTQIGAKAANLGKAISLGMNVPHSFVVTRKELEFFLRETGLRKWVCELFKEDSDRIAQQKLYEELCAAVLTAQIPEALNEEISRWAEQLIESAPAGLAVRSSGIHEDSERASFAGVYDSFLCVSSLEAIWDSIKRCWCSSWSPQVIDYARRMGVDIEPDQMAVIVQKVVQADSAGVIFTADPLTGNPWRFVLNSTFGLAQGLVGGNAPADQFVLEWDTGKILEKRIVEKAKTILPDRFGVKEMELPDDKKKAESLSDETARLIGQLALKLDRAFDLRADIEWAVEGYDIFLIQVRPVTALPEFFPHALSEHDEDVTWAPSWYIGIEKDDADLVAPLFRNVWCSEQWLRYKPQDVVLGHSEFLERDFNGYRYLAESVFRHCSLEEEQLEPWLDANEAKLRHDWLTAKQEMIQQCGITEIAREKTASTEELIADLLTARERMIDLEAVCLGPSQSLGWNCEDLLKHFVKQIAPKFATDKLLQGLPSYSYERTEAAQRLGRSIHEDAVKAVFSEKALDAIISHLLAHHKECQFLKDYENFCWQFGLRPPSWLSRPKRWATGWNIEPIQVLLVTRSAFLGQCRDIRIVREERARERMSAETEMRNILQQKEPALLARFDKILEWAQFWAPVLDARAWGYLLYFRAFELIWQTGVRLQKAGLIDAPEDVLLFTAEELERIGKADDVCKYRDLYIANKREYESNRRLAPPEYLGAPPDTRQGMDMPHQKLYANDTQIQVADKVLTGRGFTPGRVTGIARKVADLEDSDLLNSLNNEHILVCTQEAFDCDTDWLSLFMVVKGLVTLHDMPYLHHAIQIGRECGVPYVGLPNAGTDSIPDNAKIALNGTEGTVTVLEDKWNISESVKKTELG